MLRHSFSLYCTICSDVKVLTSHFKLAHLESFCDLEKIWGHALGFWATIEKIWGHALGFRATNVGQSTTITYYMIFPSKQAYK